MQKLESDHRESGRSLHAQAWLSKGQELGRRLDLRKIAGIDDGDVETVTVLLPLAGNDRRDANILHRLATPPNVTNDGVNVGRSDRGEDRLRILRILAALEHIDDHFAQRMHVRDRLGPVLAGGFLVGRTELFARYPGQARLERVIWRPPHFTGDA